MSYYWYVMRKNRIINCEFRNIRKNWRNNVLIRINYFLLFCSVPFSLVLVLSFLLFFFIFPFCRTFLVIGLSSMLSRPLLALCFIFHVFGWYNLGICYVHIGCCRAVQSLFLKILFNSFNMKKAQKIKYDIITYK